jgi:hypothetical protein
MTTQEPQTCGTGLAQNSVIPEKLGEVAAGMADVLEAHTHALDLTDGNAKTELDAYTNLVGEWRAIAAALQTTAEHMTGYRDLPIARHNAHAMAGPAVRDAFRRLVSAKQELLTLLRQQVEEGQRMLGEMGG